MESAEGKRLSMLMTSFRDGLGKALEAPNQQEFRKCFPSFDMRYATAFYDLYRQVLFQVRANCEAEFEVICEEAQLLSKFAALDELAAQQGLSQASDAGESHGPKKPADIVRAQRVSAKLQEIEDLSAILEQEEQRLASSRLSKEEGERQLQERTEAAKAISGGVDQVHAASKAWNARTAIGA